MRNKKPRHFPCKLTTYSIRAVANQVELKTYGDPEGNTYITRTVFTSITLETCETKVNKSVFQVTNLMHTSFSL